MKAFVIVAALTLLVTGCGVKNDLVKPTTGKPTNRNDPDPSKPPYPVGR